MIPVIKEISDLIPQKAPMVMVDGIIDSSENQFTSKLQLSADNIFCKNGYFTEPGLIENMAQTAALKAGYQAKKKDKKVSVGFIGAIKKCKIHKLPKENDELRTTIKQLNNMWNASIVKGEVYVGNNLMAEAELSIFTQEENS